MTDSPDHRSARVLVVEDDKMLADLVSSYLERAGHQAHVCHDGLRAVKLAEELMPDLVVLDLGLPGIDGIEVCRRIREFSDCFIMMVTGHSDEAHTLGGLEAGADDYITKPFSKTVFIHKIQAVLRRPRDGA